MHEVNEKLTDEITKDILKKITPKLKSFVAAELQDFKFKNKVLLKDIQSKNNEMEQFINDIETLKGKIINEMLSHKDFEDSESLYKNFKKRLLHDEDFKIELYNLLMDN